MRIIQSGVPLSHHIMELAVGAMFVAGTFGTIAVVPQTDWWQTLKRCDWFFADKRPIDLSEIRLALGIPEPVPPEVLQALERIAHERMDFSKQPDWSKHPKTPTER